MMERIDRATGLPRWAWLPVVLGLGDLAVAAFGYYWDVTWHIEKGRDEFIFTAPHSLIILGLLGVGACGLLAHRMFTAAGAPGAIGGRRWKTSPGAALLVVCGAFAVAGFPMDDLWHRMFGEDVTAWGPTHLIMISGAALTPLALAMLLAHGAMTNPDALERRGFRFLGVHVAAAMLVGLTAYQVEFDFGVPQFQALYHPVLIAFAASLVLVAARYTLGAGGALYAVLAYIAIRGVVDLGLVAAGRGAARFTFYIAMALVVEAGARYVRRPAWAIGAIGLGIALVGIPGEGALLGLWTYHPWSTRQMLAGMALGVPVALAGTVLGRAIAGWLRAEPRMLGGRAAVGAVVVLVAGLATPLPRAVGEPIQARIEISPARAAEAATPEHETRAGVTVALQPEDAAEGADWFEVMSWQGDGQVVAPLERDGAVYRTTETVPLGGEWKTLLRFAKGSQIVATPLYLPPDPEVGAEGFEPRPALDARLELDSKLLLREARGGPGWALLLGYGSVITVALVWIALIFWGLVRLRSDVAPAV